MLVEFLNLLHGPTKTEHFPFFERYFIIKMLDEPLQFLNKNDRGMPAIVRHFSLGMMDVCLQFLKHERDAYNLLYMYFFYKHDKGMPIMCLHFLRKIYR